MSKRRYNPAMEEDRTSIVEKLYKQSQPSFHAAGGFLADDDEREEIREQIAEANQKKNDAAARSIVMPDDCMQCKKPLIESWLWERYNHAVCDACRDDQGEHKLMPRTEVKSLYLLKDEDLDLRKPPLRFYAKKNPHNPRYGHMKLYLKCQVIQRMLDVHGSWEELEEEKSKRSDIKEARTERIFEKKIKEMRQQIRGINAPRVQSAKSHEHRFGEEEYDKKKDEYKKTCIDCDYVMTFEKM